MTTATAPTPSARRSPMAGLRSWLLDVVNDRWHRRVLLLYLLVVASHFAEHAMQVVQVYLFDWPRATAGGLLGIVLPGLAAAEVLHTVWNSLQLTGLIVLLPGFGRVRPALAWWWLAIALQTWHWFEHAVIQFQYITGIYLYGAVKQVSILEGLLPRIELHFLYNVAVFLPTMIAVALYLHGRRGGGRRDA